MGDSGSKQQDDVSHEEQVILATPWFTQNSTPRLSLGTAMFSAAASADPNHSA